jgi:CHAT domain-containing protein
MDELYSRLAAGESPDRALRNAKLAMLNDGPGMALPYNWAAFQRYVGSY